MAAWGQGAIFIGGERRPYADPIDCERYQIPFILPIGTDGPRPTPPGGYIELRTANGRPATASGNFPIPSNRAGFLTPAFSSHPCVYPYRNSTGLISHSDRLGARRFFHNVALPPYLTRVIPLVAIILTDRNKTTKKVRGDGVNL